MEPGEEYIFVCSACEESMEVNESMKDALIENGCVICSSPVSSDEFTPTKHSPQK